MASSASTAGAGTHHVHDALMDDRDGLVGCLPATRRRPGQAELADIAAVDRAERAKPLLVVGAIEHQPIVGTRLLPASRA